MKAERFMSFKVTGYNKLVLNNPKYKLAINTAAARQAAMIRDRFTKQGRDSNGNKLKKVAERTGWCWFGVQDPRFRGMRGFMFNRPWERAPLRWVYWRGYRRLKAQMSGGRTWRGAPLTGNMWNNLELQVRPGKKGEGSAVFRLHFAKGQRVGFVRGEFTKKNRRGTMYVRNRDKARMLQYDKRTKDGQPYNQAFVLMEPSKEEKAAVLQILGSGIKFADS